MVLVFRRPLYLSDSVIALRAGPLVHVEILPIDSETPENTISYTSYVGCQFAMSISTKNTFDNQTCVALSLDLSVKEHQCLISYLHDLCEANIPYNYADVAFMALPHSVLQAVVDDVPSEDPRDLRSLFCSQAALLALRNSLAAEHPLVPVLSGVVSRTVFPYSLFLLLRPFTRTVDCLALSRGAVLPYSVTCPL